MRKQLFLVIILMLTTLVSRQLLAQGKGIHKFSSINQVGLLMGQNGQSAILETINGIEHNACFVGLGAGIDFYHTRTLPLFIDVRRNLSDKPVAPFLYADGGVNFAWATVNQVMNKGYAFTSKPGAYYGAGIGYNITSKHSPNILLSAGYSYKQVKERTEAFTVWQGPTGQTSQEIYNYRLRRIVVKLALIF